MLALCGATIGVLLAVGVAARAGAPRRASGPLPSSIYVWQRAWSEDVGASLREASGRVEDAIVLAAEVDWDQGRLRVVRVPVDYERLRETRLNVGLALRIGPYPGPFGETGEPIDAIAALGSELIREAGVAVGELHIDFDCAESKLDGYRLWLRAIRGKAGATPVTITALPCWLQRRAFAQVAQETDGYVLQVHSLERPANVEGPLTLCDPAAARRAVERAGRIGVPFRVALATYGYYVAFDGDGRFVGLQAEGPAVTWPEGVRIRVVRSDPVQTAALVRGWTADRPAALQGIIWFRLPTDADGLNWRWPTLRAVMDGRVPAGRCIAEATRPEPGLIEIRLINAGDADGPVPACIVARWKNARLAAGDALGGFEMGEAEPGRVEFRIARPAEVSYLAPGRSRTVGWLRLEPDKEVQIDVAPNEP